MSVLIKSYMYMLPDTVLMPLYCPGQTTLHTYDLSGWLWGISPFPSFRGDESLPGDDLPVFTGTNASERNNFFFHYTSNSEEKVLQWFFKLYTCRLKFVSCNFLESLIGNALVPMQLLIFLLNFIPWHGFKYYIYKALT